MAVNTWHNNELLEMLFSMRSVLLYHVTTSNLWNLVDKFTDWEQFQNLASELGSPRIQINSLVEANKAACNFTASVASAYRLSTRKITFLDFDKDLSGLESLLKHKWRLRKLASNPGCSM
jgi:hypothetical protein